MTGWVKKGLSTLSHFPCHGAVSDIGSIVDIGPMNFPRQFVSVMLSLPDGSPSLIVVSDNNQTDCEPHGPPPEATVFLLFRLNED